MLVSMSTTTCIYPSLRHQAQNVTFARPIQNSRPSQCKILEVVSAHRPRAATLNLHITVGIITVGFVRTVSDVPSLPVMSLKMKKMIGAGLKPAVKDHITVGLWLEPAVFWRPLITAGLSQELTVIGLYHCRF